MSSFKDLILAVNAGSSSLKISLFSPSSQINSEENVSLILTSSISSISSPPALFSYKSEKGEGGRDASTVKDKKVSSVSDHGSALSFFLSTLKEKSDIDPNAISTVCHRIVHGGNYEDAVVIDDQSLHHIKELTNLAPLHNGSALALVSACRSALPEAVSAAFFDTSFHRTIPAHISTYPIDQKIAQRYGLKKYGFHGISCELNNGPGTHFHSNVTDSFILRAVSRFLSKPTESVNAIILHLGSGSSVTAVHNGQSHDTSMGLTPLSGLPGATRAGSVDPSLIFHYGENMTDEKDDRGVTKAETILNTKGGWQALAGTTDFGLLTSHAFASPPSVKDRLAFDLFVDRIVQFVGGYYVKLASLGSVDAIVFSGGIGERSPQLREAVVRHLKCLGFAVDPDRNVRVGDTEDIVVDIGDDRHGGKKVLVCRTDEQEEMARQWLSKTQ